MNTIEIKGIWLLKKHGHLGNNIEVLVELPDGTYRVAISGYQCDDNAISHYVHPGGIQDATVREFLYDGRPPYPSP